MQYGTGAVDVCGRSMTILAVAVKHSNYCIRCYSHVTTANTSSGLADTFEGLYERTEHLDIFLFSAHHSIVFYFQCSVYWWRGSVRF